MHRPKKYNYKESIPSATGRELRPEHNTQDPKASLQNLFYEETCPADEELVFKVISQYYSVVFRVEILHFLGLFSSPEPGHISSFPWWLRFKPIL